MIDVDLPADPTTSLLVRSFAACVASVTETPPEHLPRPAADLDGSLGTWRTWLAETVPLIVMCCSRLSRSRP